MVALSKASRSLNKPRRFAVLRDRFGSWIGCVLACALAGIASSAHAQQSSPPPQGDDASVVAAAVQSFYDQTHDLSAEFFQTYVNKLYQRTDRSKGRVVFKKPGMMRWDYAQPNGKVIVSDGKRLVVYEP